MSENTAQSADLRLRQYEALLGPSKAIATHRNLSDLLHRLAGHLRDLFDFHNLGIILHDASRNVLCLHILETNEPAMWRLPTEIPIEGSITGWVWQNQQPFVTSDACLEIRFPATKMVLDTPLRSVCVLPLTTVHRRLGVFCFASQELGAYDQLDLEFAQLVAAQIAVAVENALSFQEAESYQRQLAHERDRSHLLLGVNNVLVSTLNLRELLSAISACLKRVTPHNGASPALYDPASNMLRVSGLEFPGHEDVMMEGELFPLEGSRTDLALTTRCAVLSDAGTESGCTVPVFPHDR